LEDAMRAHVGDWLIVEGSSEQMHARRAKILAVDSADGAPPYRVRWFDTGHEGLVFPGPDAHVVSAAEQAEIERVSSERSARQSTIRQRE
jgi:Domain of unknown function (DUF1918)